MEFSVLGLNDNARVSLNTREKNGITYVDIKMTLDNVSIPEKFKIRWSYPDIDIYSVWSPSLKADRFFGAQLEKAHNKFKACVMDARAFAHFNERAQQAVHRTVGHKDARIHSHRHTRGNRRL